MAYNRKDYFFHKAKEQNFAARSVFKLEEIDKRFRILRRGALVLDLGAAPGSWAQFTSKAIGPEGKILGIDLQKINLTLPNATFILGDVREKKEEIEKFLEGKKFNIVLSDMAPRTTGIAITDQARSMELCQFALDQAKIWLGKRGHFVCKMFHSEDFEGFRDQIKEGFDKIEILRPKSTRKESREIFLIGIGFKG